MRSRTPRNPDSIERTQTGVRLEKRLLKVLKALAELYDLSLAEFLEDMVRDAFAGRAPLLGAALDHAAELMRIYGLEPAPGRPEGDRADAL
jgi:ABC-type transporter Mla subunit MlaD